LWLFASAFLWPHPRAQLHNAWVVGLLVVTLAVAGMDGLRWGRYLNAVLGAWLIISALFFSPAAGATYWNHTLVGIAILALGLSPTLRNFRRRQPVPS
jgi:hypothetical protein